MIFEKGRKKYKEEEKLDYKIHFLYLTFKFNMHKNEKVKREYLKERIRNTLSMKKTWRIGGKS
jgi:hypothetical protein